MAGLALHYSTSFGMAFGINDLVESGCNKIMSKNWLGNGITEIGSRVITSGATFWVPLYLSGSGVLKEKPYLRYASPILEKRMFVSTIGNGCFTAWHLAAGIGAKIINKDDILAENHFKAFKKFAWRAAFDGLAMTFLPSEIINYITFAEGLLNTLAPRQMRDCYNSVTDFIDNKIIGEEVPSLMAEDRLREKLADDKRFKDLYEDLRDDFIKKILKRYNPKEKTSRPEVGRAAIPDEPDEKNDQLKNDLKKMLENNQRANDLLHQAEVDLEIEKAAIPDEKKETPDEFRRGLQKVQERVKKLDSGLEELQKRSAAEKAADDKKDAASEESRRSLKEAQEGVIKHDGDLEETQSPAAEEEALRDLQEKLERIKAGRAADDKKDTRALLEGEKATAAVVSGTK
jgi:hypothetical protein